MINACPELGRLVANTNLPNTCSILRNKPDTNRVKIEHLIRLKSIKSKRYFLFVDFINRLAKANTIYTNTKELRTSNASLSDTNIQIAASARLASVKWPTSGLVVFFFIRASLYLCSDYFTPVSSDNTNNPLKKLNISGHLVIMRAQKV